MKTQLSPVEKVLCLQKVDIFKHATTEMLTYVSSIAEEVAASRESVLFAEHEMSDAMYVVVSGRVRLEKEGKEIIIVGASQSFGTWALFDNTPRLMTAAAVEDTLLLRIYSESFYEFLADHEEVTPAIFKAVIERVKALAPEAL
jgi:CRP-like cAMP-binding protein